MKNPNGYGSVIKLGGKRRKPFAARITNGWDDNGKQLFRYLGYYESRQEALIALADHHKDPHVMDASTITFAEIYLRYSQEKFWSSDETLKVSESTYNTYKMAYGISEKLHNIKFVDIRKNHMQSILDACDKAYETKKKVKTLYNQLFRYAMENDLVEKDYAAYVTLGEDTTVSNREPFNGHEIQTLWDNIGKAKYADVALIMIYTGLRPGELLAMKNADVHIADRYMRGGLKTAAGKNRVIPLNKKIIPLIQNRLNASEHLIADVKGAKDKARYDNFKNDWDAMMKHLGMSHTPHECRHTFATLMDNADANRTSIKRIMGHASRSVTSKVYTHKDIEQLIRAVDLI